MSPCAFQQPAAKEKISKGAHNLGSRIWKFILAYTSIPLSATSATILPDLNLRKIDDCYYPNAACLAKLIPSETLTAALLHCCTAALHHDK